MRSPHEYFAIIKGKILGTTGKNISWLTGDKLVRLAIGTVVGALIARYLKPEGYGLLNFFIAYSGIFSPIASFGINPILARDLPQQKDKQSSILQSSIIIKGAALAVSISAGLLWGFFSGQLDKATTILYLLASVGSLGFIFEGFDVYHQARQDAKTVVTFRFSAFLFCSIFRILGVVLGMPIGYFVFFMSLDFLLGSLFLFIATMRSGLRFSWKEIDWPRIKKYVPEGVIITLGAILTAIYMRADKLIIQHIFGNAPLGIYSAATKLSELWFFVPAAISTVYAPILAAQFSEKEKYKKTLRKQMVLSVYASYGIALVTTVFGSLLVKVLYGEDYEAAISPLRYHIWSLVFVALGNAQIAWNTIERRQLQFLGRTIIGTIVSITLYNLLIPKLGLNGAAIATTVSYSVPNFLSNYFHKSTREMFWMQLSVLIPSWRNIKLIFS